MKNILLGLSGIVVLSLTAASLTWLIVGEPDRSVPCDPESLEQGQVCFSEVQSWEKGSYLWVDARNRKLWEKNGVEGSVLLTDDNAEDYDVLEQNFAETAFRGGDSYQRIVVYCGAKGCETSKEIAKSLRNKFTSMMDFEVYVLFGGWKAFPVEE